MKLSPKRKIKDTVFKSIFSDKRNLLKLYNVLHPEDDNVSQDDLVDITLESVLADSIYNDLGFRVKDKLIIMVEAQSTWSPNIVIRSLTYLVKTLQDYCIDNKINLYGSKKAELPKPELYVIYTGKQGNKPSTISLKKDFYPGQDCAIDATVKIIFEDGSANIINEYIQFCMIADEQIRKYGRKEKAINEILRICKDKKLLSEFLAKRTKEVKGIMGELFNQDWVKEVYLNERIDEAVAEKDAEIAEKDAEIAEKDAEIARMNAEIAELKLLRAKENK